MTTRAKRVVNVGSTCFRDCPIVLPYGVIPGPTSLPNVPIMSTVVILDQSELEVLPGEEASCGLRIRNDGTIVESYSLEVLGDAAGWAVSDPDTVSIYPGTEAHCVIRFQPQRSSQILAGEVPFGVRVAPVEKSTDQSVVEGVVRVLPFADTTAELTPRTSTGRRSGRHELAIDNRGNTPLKVALSGSDPDRRLAVAIRPATLTIEPGEAGFAAVRARPRRLRWRGQPATHPFQVRVESAETEEPAPDGTTVQLTLDGNTLPLTLDGATVQLPILPQGLLRVLAAGLVLVLAAAGLWFAVLRPAVRSTARDAADAKMEPAMQKVEEANQSAQQAAQEAASAAGNPSPQAAKPGPAPSAAAPVVVALPQGATSLSRRLQTTSQQGATVADQFTVPAGKILVITDIIFQNPQGDEGRLDFLVNNQTLITVSLANFRDLDYHLVSPIEIPAGQALSIRTTCSKPGSVLPGAAGGSQCRVFALLGGYQNAAPSASPSATAAR